jgi:hypothetical protein
MPPTERSRLASSTVTMTATGYLPVVGFLSLDQESEQYLVTVVLRSGNASGSAGAIGILRRLIGRRVKQAFPEARMRI